MKTALTLLTLGALAGFGASTFVHIRGMTGAGAEAWPLTLGVFSAGVALTLATLLAAWRVGLGRADGWWSRAMDGLSTWTYLAVAAALVYGLAVVAYVAWSVRRAGTGSMQSGVTVSGATFMFFYAVLFAAARSLGIAARADRRP